MVKTFLNELFGILSHDHLKFRGNLHITFPVRFQNRIQLVFLVLEHDLLDEVSVQKQVEL